MQKKLPGLNGLRAIAASFVLFSHVIQIAGDAGDASMAGLFEQHKLLGKDMVNLFFVISGFIITWILLHEREKTGTVSLKNFYIKRLLRIWPLYFGILIIVILLNKFTHVYALYPPINGLGILIVCLFMLNIRDTLPNPQISVLQHYWSLSIEEQFYIFWPLLFKKLKTRTIVYVAIGIIIFMALARNIVAWQYTLHPNEYMVSILNFFIGSLFGSIAIGVLGAWLLFRQHRALKMLYNPLLQLAAWVMIAVMIVAPIYIPYIHFEITGLCYLVLILNVTSNTTAIWKAENRFLDQTGTISYGLYMFHWPLIPLVIITVKKAGLWTLFMQWHQIPLMALCYGLTWLIAYLSYRYFETYFLKFRSGKQPAL